MTETLCERECTRSDGTPFLATHGRYCTRCWGRLDYPLSEAAELAAHLVALTSTQGGASDDRIDTSRDAPLPLNQAAFDDASELYAMLVYWTRVWALTLGRPVPTMAVRAWRTDTGKIIGMAAGTTALQAADMVTKLATWLRNRLDTILALIDHTDDIEAFTDQLGDVYRMNARWPRIDRPAYSKMPCPRDDCGAKIAVYPPTFGPWTDTAGKTHPGDARRIVCTNGHWYPEEEYEHLLLVFQQVREEQDRVAKTAAHLAKKYGIRA